MSDLNVQCVSAELSNVRGVWIQCQMWNANALSSEIKSVHNHAFTISISQSDVNKIHENIDVNKMH